MLQVLGPQGILELGDSLIFIKKCQLYACTLGSIAGTRVGSRA